MINSRDGRKIKAGRLIRMHSAQMEEVDAIPAGHIGAMFGVDCASGDTFVSSKINYTMLAMLVYLFPFFTPWSSRSLGIPY